MLDRILIYSLVVLTMMAKLCQGQICHCGYGGLCLMFNNRWLDAPCLCSEINSGETAVYGTGNTCGEPIDYCPGKKNCPSCRKTWGFSNCVCRENPKRIILPNCSVNMPDWLPSPLEPMFFSPTLGWHWNKVFMFFLTVTSGSLQGLLLKITVADGRNPWYLYNLESRMERNFRPTCDLLVRAFPESIRGDVCGVISPYTRVLAESFNFAINLRLEDNMKIKNEYYPYEIVGRMETVTLELIANGGNVIFTHSARLFINYPYGLIKCAREIRIHGCSAKHLEPTVYELDDEINLRATFTEYNKCETLKVKNAIWALDYQAYNFKSADEHGHKKTIPPFSLAVGKYMIYLKLELYGSTTTHSVEETFTQSHYCYFEVHRGVFSFMIVGGSRTIICKSPVEIKIRITNDNYRLEDTKIYWSCASKQEKRCREKLGGEKQVVNLPCDENETYKVRIVVKGDSGKEEEFTDFVSLWARKQELELRCTRGCEYSRINPNSELVVRVIEKPVVSGDVNWTVKVSPSGPSLNLTSNNFRRSSRHDVLIIMPLTLDQGKTYRITVTKESGSGAELEITVAIAPPRPDCSISPSEGIVGSMFTIDCKTNNSDDSSLSYELLDAGHGERKVLLHSSTSSTMRNVVLHSENFTVRVRNQFAMFSDAIMTVKLKPIDVTNQEIEEIFSRMARQLSADDEDGCLEDMIDLIEKIDTCVGKFPPNFKKRATQKLAEMKIFDERQKIEQVVNVVDFIVDELDVEERDADRVTLAASNVLLNVANSMQKVYQKSKNIRHISQISLHLLEFINATSSVIYYEDPLLLKFSETAEVKQIHIRRKEKVGENTVESFKQVADTIFNMSTPELDEFVAVGEKITVWTMNDEAQYLNNASLEKLGQMPVFEFSNEALKIYNGKTLGVFMGIFDKEWISWTKFRPVGKIVNVLLYSSNGSSLNPMGRQRGPFYVSYPMGPINCITLTGQAVLPSGEMNIYSQDHTVTVVHFRLPPNSGVFQIQLGKSLISKIR